MGWDEFPPTSDKLMTLSNGGKGRMRGLLQSDPQMQQRSAARGPGGHRTQCSGDPSHGERPGDMGSGTDRTLLVSGDLCSGRGLLLCDEDTDAHRIPSDDRHSVPAMVTQAHGRRPAQWGHRRGHTARARALQSAFCCMSPGSLLRPIKSNQIQLRKETFISKELLQGGRGTVTGDASILMGVGIIPGEEPLYLYKGQCYWREVTHMIEGAMGQ